jgi:HD-like signal output (HDOD) protein
MINSREYALQANGSFALPDACFKVKALMEDENSEISDFADVISIDPSMTSRLLQIANSAIYSFPGEISTISRAITIIGTQAIYNMMLVDVAASAFKHFSNQAIDLKRFWRMSIYCGLATKYIAIKAGVKDIERLFVAGLLQNFGELIVAKISPEIAQGCEKYNRDHLPWDLQKSALSFSYTDISAELLKIWQLPEKIIIPIRHFNQAKSNQINKDVKILNLASRLALLDSHPEEFDYDTVIDQSLCENLGLNKDDLDQVAEISAADAIDILTVINPKLFSR